MSKVKFTGKSEEDAVRKAADVLSTAPAKVDYKIVSRSGGLLGLLGQTVTIEVTVGETPAPTPPPLPPKARQPKKEHRDRGRQQREETSKDEGEGEAPQPADDQERPPRKPEERKEGGRRRGRGRRGPRRPDSEERKGGERSRQGQSRERTRKPSPQEPVDEAIMAEKLEKTRAVTQGILEKVDAVPEIAVKAQQSEIHVTLSGDMPEWLVRGRERTLESLQFVTNKIVNRFPPRYRVIIDLEGQKEERQNQLEQMAVRLAEKVVASGEPVWILPMSPRERRMVHMALADRKDVETQSHGDGPSRRICIKLISAPSQAKVEPEEEPTEEKMSPPEDTSAPVEADGNEEEMSQELEGLPPSD